MAGFFKNISNTTVQESAEADALASQIAAAASEAAALVSKTASAASAASAAVSADSASSFVNTNAASASASEVSNQASLAAKAAALVALAAAETAEDNAAGSQSNSASSATAAAASATAAEASKVTSVTNAQTSITKASESASSAVNSAASAASVASTATASETARAASVVAKDASVVAKNESVVAKDASVVAKNASVAAQAAAETAETNAETAETNSASSATASANSATASANSATASEASKVTSVNSASTATTKASEASTSATSAAASYDLFDDRMLGAKSSAPTVDNDGASLVQGTLYFDTSSQTMKVYGASGWVPAGSSVNGTSARFKFVSTNNQTTFSGSDANSQTLAYDAGFLDVYLSGLRLVNGTDFTATTGTNIVLASGAATGDILEIVAYGTFVLANFNADKLDGQHGSYYTGYTDTAVSNLVNSSPAALDTLQELATALGNDVNFSTTVTNSIATKAALAGATFTGEITANAGIALPDSQKATFGASDDLQIYHDGSNSYIEDTGSGVLFIKGTGGVYLRGKDSDEDLGRFLENGAVDLYFNGASKLATTSTGIDVTGTATMDAATVQTTGSTTAVLTLNNANGNGTLSQINLGYTADPDHGNISYTGDMIFTASAAERMRIDSGGVAHFNGDVKVLSGDIQMGSGRGINFSPSSNAGGMTSETLSDYEQGVWNPTAYGSGATGATTYGQQYGSYTKIGNTVHVTFYLGISGMTGTGSIRIGGLPFNSASGSQYLTTGSCMTDALTWGTSKTMLVPYIQGGVNFLFLYGSSGDAGSWANTPVDASWTIIGTITYTAV